MSDTNITSPVDLALTERYKFWLTVGRNGIVLSPENEGVIIEWLAAGGYPATASSLDVAIQTLHAQQKLKWVPKPVAPPPPPPVRTVEDGLPELPINADDFTLSTATRPQLDDLLRRQHGNKPVNQPTEFPPRPKELTQEALHKAGRKNPTLLAKWREKYGDTQFVNRWYGRD